MLKNNLFLLILIPMALACQERNDYPKLIDEDIEYSFEDFEKEHFDDFSTYKDIVTKNTKLPLCRETISAP